MPWGPGGPREHAPRLPPHPTPPPTPPCRSAAMGVGEGVTYPSIQNLARKWVPESKRSRALAFIYSGHQLGTIGSYLLCPLLIRCGRWGETTSSRSHAHRLVPGCRGRAPRIGPFYGLRAVTYQRSLRRAPRLPSGPLPAASWAGSPSSLDLARWVSSGCSSGSRWSRMRRRRRHNRGTGRAPPAPAPAPAPPRRRPRCGFRTCPGPRLRAAGPSGRLWRRSPRCRWATCSPSRGCPPFTTRWVGLRRRLWWEAPWRQREQGRHGTMDAQRCRWHGRPDLPGMRPATRRPRPWPQPCSCSPC